MGKKIRSQALIIKIKERNKRRKQQQDVQNVVHWHRIRSIALERDKMSSGTNAALSYIIHKNSIDICGFTAIQLVVVSCRYFFCRNKFNFIQSRDLLLRERVNKVRIFVLVAINSSAAFFFFCVVVVVPTKGVDDRIKNILGSFFFLCLFYLMRREKGTNFVYVFFFFRLDTKKENKWRTL